MAENKVMFGLKNVHYAILEDGSFGTPVAIPGAVNLSLEAEGDVSKFYADNIVYYQTAANQGYSGDLEIARIPDQMLQDVWGYTLGGTDKVLTENANAEPKTFALLYEINGDKDAEYYCLYACTATRPNIGSATVEESKEVQTRTCTINAVPMADGKVMARTSKDTPANVKTSWFTTVFAGE